MRTSTPWLVLAAITLGFMIYAATTDAPDFLIPVLMVVVFVLVAVSQRFASKGATPSE